MFKSVTVYVFNYLEEPIVGATVYFIQDEGTLDLTTNSEGKVNTFVETDTFIELEIVKSGYVTQYISSEQIIDDITYIFTLQSTGVPNTTDFTLKDVCNYVIPPTLDLQSCFDVAVDEYFNSTYKGSKDSLSNFRDYKYRSTTYNLTSNTYALSWGYLGGYRSFFISQTNLNYWTFSFDENVWFVKMSPLVNTSSNFNLGFSIFCQSSFVDKHDTIIIKGYTSDNVLRRTIYIDCKQSLFGL